MTSELSAIETQIALALGEAIPRAGQGAVRNVRRGGEVGDGRAAKPDKAKRGKRGAIKEAILESLKSAEGAGVAVKDLATKLGLKNQNVYVWFHTTGKKLKEIQKAGKGLYKYVAITPSTETISPIPAKPKPARPKRKTAAKKK